MPNSRPTIHHTPLTEHLSDEMKFLIACCQVEPSEEDINFIISYLKAERLDLLELNSDTPVIKMKEGCNTLIRLANQHCILPLLYKTIKNLSENDDLDTERLTLNTFLSKLKPLYMSIVQRNMLMTSELIKIMHLLRDNHIEALAFKGPTLSQIAYGDITLRQYVDLDILIDEQIVAKVGKLLLENGFKPVHSIKLLTNLICLELEKDFSFFNPSDQIHIEVHWRLVPKELNTYFDFEKLIQEKQSVTINGKMPSTLSSEHLLTYLCIHGSKHAWERIEWICDIDRLIRSNNIDWDKVLTYTKSKNDRRPLLLGLLLCQKFFQTPFPDKIIKIMADEPELNKLPIEVMDFFNNTSLNHNDLQRIYFIKFFVAKVFDKKENKIVIFLKHLFKVSNKDCQYFLLPEKLKFLYIFLRPIRLIHNRLKSRDIKIFK